MNMNQVGKFETRKIMNDFDAALIRVFGVNMLDAKITRHEALSAYDEVQCAHKAAELCGVRRGLAPQAV
ncbi:MAG TPA: hypothetical protein VI279_03355 [Rhodocyclaceae bacterium]